MSASVAVKITNKNHDTDCIYLLFPSSSGSLMYLNEATLLNNVRVRYNKDHIYVCASSSHLASSPSWCKIVFYSLWCFQSLWPDAVHFLHPFCWVASWADRVTGWRTDGGRDPSLVSLWGKAAGGKEGRSNCQTSKPNRDPSHSLRKLGADGRQRGGSRKTS